MKNNYSFKALFISFLLLIFSNPALYSQAFLPFAQSNYAGSSGLILQPASIADSRYKCKRKRQVYIWGSFRYFSHFHGKSEPKICPCFLIAPQIHVKY